MKQNAKVISLELKIINKSKQKVKSALLTKTERKLAKVQKRLKNEMQRSGEL